MQRFGGRWTEAKLAALQEYLTSFTIAMKRQPFKLHYIDAFAGSGTFVATTDTRNEVRKGSAQIALATTGFDQYVFIEKGAKRCEALRNMVSTYKGRAWVFEGDANTHLGHLCESIDWRGSRAVLFLDPYGMQVAWETLRRVAETGAIDVWYLFPLNGVTRQLALNEGRLDEDKRRSLDRVLGTNEWRDAFYSQTPVDLFGDSKVERHADSNAIAAWVTRRLKEVFPIVEGPVLLRKNRAGMPGSGPPLFALYLLVSNPSPKAKGLASKIAKGVFAKLSRDGAI